MCLSALVGVDVRARVKGKHKECCWLKKRGAAYFLAVLFLSVFTSQRKV